LNRKRLTAGLLVAGVVFGAVFAVAASLTVTSDSLGSGSAAVSSCDGNGVSVSYTVTYDAASATYEVTSVTVGGIADSACDGRTVSVALANSSNGSLGSGSATNTADADTADNSVSVPIPSAPAASAVANVHVVI
jgi:hypothetical protein